MHLEHRFTKREARLSNDTHVEGYGSVFGVEDDYGSVVMPGAFARSLAEHRAAGTMPLMLYNHWQDEVLGTWTDVKEDEAGLAVQGFFSDTQRGREVRTLLKDKALEGLSIGFSVRESDFSADGVRLIRDVDLWEVSVVGFPANREAKVLDVRSREALQLPRKSVERALRDAGMSKRDAKRVVSQLASQSSGVTPAAFSQSPVADALRDAGLRKPVVQTQFSQPASQPSGATPAAVSSTWRDAEYLQGDFPHRRDADVAEDELLHALHGLRDRVLAAAL